jgi:hypothetical protein
MLASGDAAPSGQAVAESEDLRREIDRLDARWNALRTVELSTLNGELRASGVPPIGMEK